MKKNVMMRAASVLLIMVLLTSSVISGTFAKYVSTGKSTDSARVAKWGVTITGNGETFADAYTDEKAAYDNGVASVLSEVLGDDVVAPGTKGNLADFEIVGKPEVDVAVTYTANLKLENWSIASGEYCPIIFTVNGQYFYIGQAGIDSIAALETAVEDAIVAAKAEYDALTDLSTVVHEDLAVSWEWLFENGAAGEQSDGKDTELGNWSAKGKAAPTISLEVTCTITQID